MFTRKNSRSSDISSHPSVLELTFRVLPPRDLAAAACVCREWRAAATSEPLWHRHTIARWPALASPAVARRVSDSCGFYLFYRKRFLRPGRASPLPFHLDDLTFFFDLSFHGSPVFSQAFKYEGGRALVPFAHHTFSDPSAIFPSIEALDKDSFRRSLAVNWTVLRRTDGRGSCAAAAAGAGATAAGGGGEGLVLTLGLGCGDGAPGAAAAVAAGGSGQQEGTHAPGNGAGGQQQSLDSSLSRDSQPGATAAAGAAGAGAGAGAAQAGAAAAHDTHLRGSGPKEQVQVPALKMVFNTALGGLVGQVFYGMMKVSFTLPLQEKLIPASSSGSSIGTSSSSSNTTNLMGAAAAAAAAGVAAAAAAAGGAGAAANVEMTPVNVLARTGAMEVNLTALKDRLGGTVRVDIAGKEFLLVLSALQWE
ncbi:unnamed protein product [Closterium sp. NIES-64]|nr:unnamed protein product [Closterium sp. NIES-64]